MDELKVDRLKGMFFGLVVGDALGTTLEFKTRDTYEHITDMIGGGSFNLQPGEWTDDTSMALALAQTLIDHGFDPTNDSIVFRNELLKNFTRWYKYGEFSHNGRCFDIGTTTRNAIQKFINSKGQDNYPGSDHVLDSGNGGIMRLAPAVVWGMSQYENNSKEWVVRISQIQSETTHASPECIRTARDMAADLYSYVSGDLHSIRVRELIDSQTHRDVIKSSGYVVDTWVAANWAVSRTNNFRDALLLAVNLGDDADTVGAVTGQIAGALYGYAAIPPEWIAKLSWRKNLEETFEKMITLDRTT